jgi:DNA recombination protein RmuC
MPNGRTIIVDAKTPLDAFLDGEKTDDAVLKTAKFTAHAARVRAHLDQLSSKAYWKQFVDSPDFIVCFLPGEGLFSAALEQDPGLIEYSASSGVLLATPTTLIALLKAVAFGWQQAEIAKNAQAIKDTALDAYGKLAGLYGDFADLGNRLKAAGESYDKMLTKAEGRGGLFSVSRKLKGLSIGEKELGESKPVAMTLKPMLADDWQTGLALAAGEGLDGE